MQDEADKNKLSGTTAQIFYFPQRPARGPFGGNSQSADLSLIKKGADLPPVVVTPDPLDVPYRLEPTSHRQGKTDKNAHHVTIEAEPLFSFPPLTADIGTENLVIAHQRAPEPSQPWIAPAIPRQAPFAVVASSSRGYFPSAAREILRPVPKRRWGRSALAALVAAIGMLIPNSAGLAPVAGNQIIGKIDNGHYRPGPR